MGREQAGGRVEGASEGLGRELRLGPAGCWLM